MTHGSRMRWTGALAGGAAALAGLKHYSGRQMRRAEAEFPPAGRFVESGDVCLHFVEQGSGQPVVFLHGIAGFLQDFAEVLGPAAARHRALAFDRPGHGYSTRPPGRPMGAEAQADVLHGALAALGAERPVLVGHSWGGALALAYAIRYPDEVAGLVLLGTVAYDLSGYGPQLALARVLRTPLLGDGLLATLAVPAGRPSVPHLLARAFWPDPVPPGYARMAAALWSRPSQVRAIAEDGATLPATLRRLSPHYPDIRVPVTLVTGDCDRIVDPEGHSYPLHRVVPHSRLVVLPRTGHALAATHPEAVVQAIGQVVGDRQ